MAHPSPTAGRNEADRFVDLWLRRLSYFTRRQEMTIPYIIEEFKNNEWHRVSNPESKIYAKAQYETLVCMRKTVRVKYDGKVIFSN
jgi:hypothetical protein